MPGTIKAVRSVEVNETGEVQFVCETEDGGEETLTCPREKVSDVLLRVSSYNMGLLPKTSTPMPPPTVSYEAGTGRVAMSIPTKAGTLHIAMGHEDARELAKNLTGAAEASLQKPNKN